MGINRYYNVPVPADLTGIPAVCVGVNYAEKDGERPALRFIVKRDLTVQIRSFTLVYRFSTASVRTKDPEHPYFRFTYDKADINQRDYIILKGYAPDGGIPEGCTAVVASVTLENGETVSYRTGTFTDPTHLIAASETMEPLLAAYFAQRNAVKTAQEPKKKSPVQALAEKAAAVTVVDVPDVKPVKQSKKSGKKKLLRRHTAETVTVITVILLFIGGVLIFGTRDRTVEKPMDTVVARLLDAGRYGDAYKTAQDKNDTEGMQNVCRTASASYLFAKDYENAYLYAAAAPEPFEREVIDVFISLLITQNRQEEAYEFLTGLPQYTDAMQRVCQSAVDRSLASGDYADAYFYAREAPQSLETYVMEYAAGEIIRDGHVNEDIFAALESLDDSKAFDDMAQKAADKLMDEKSYREAAAVACQIRDDTGRMTAIKSICETGMKQYVNAENLAAASELYTFCTPMMDEASLKKSVQAMIDYSRICGNTAGVIYFTSLSGGDTSSMEIDVEDSSIRRQAELTWFLLTADQKRAFHAREMDLYKEAFQIVSSRIEDITDAVSVAASEHMAVVLRQNGTVSALSNNGRNQIPTLPADNDIVQIDVGRDHVVLLHNDGTVTAMGSNASGQCDVSQWTNVVKVVAGADFTAGLRSDGTLYACGSNISGQCDVDGITGVMDIAACDRTLVLLMSDKTVRLAGNISMGLKRAENFSDVRRIRAGGCCIIAETDEGTYMMAQGTYNANCGSVITWKNTRDFAAGSLCIGRVDQNGSMKIEGDGAPVTHPGYEANGQ